MKQFYCENKDLVFNALQHWMKIYNCRKNKICIPIKSFENVKNLSDLEQNNNDDLERIVQNEEEPQISNKLGMSFGESPLFSFRSDTKFESSIEEQKSTTRDKFKNLSEEEVAAEFERVRKEHGQLRLNKLKLQELKQKEIDDLKRKEEEDKQKAFYQNQQKKNQLIEKVEYLKSQITFYNSKVNKFSRIEAEYNFGDCNRLLNCEC